MSNANGVIYEANDVIVNCHLLMEIWINALPVGRDEHGLVLPTDGSQGVKLKRIITDR